MFVVYTAYVRIVKLPIRVNMYRRILVLDIGRVRVEVFNSLDDVLVKLEEWQPIAFLHWSIDTPIFLIVGT